MNFLEPDTQSGASPSENIVAFYKPQSTALPPLRMLMLCSTPSVDYMPAHKCTLGAIHDAQHTGMGKPAGAA